MPLVAVIGVALSYLTKFFITKALLALGLGYVSFIGISEVHEWFETQFIFAYNALPPDIYALATLAGLDDAIKIIMSSFATAWGIKTIGAASTAVLRFTGVSAP